MGYLKPHGTTGISPIILGFDEEWFEGEGFNHPNTFTPIEDIFNLQAWLCAVEEDVVVLDEEDDDEDTTNTSELRYWLEIVSDSTKLHFREMAEDAGLNPKHYDLSSRRAHGAIIEAWVNSRYSDYTDDEDVSEIPKQWELTPTKADRIKELEKRCIEPEERARQPHNKGREGRRLHWSQSARWNRRIFISDETSIVELPVYEVLIEYPHREVREIRTEQYYSALLQRCRFSLADHNGEGDEHFWDEDRFRPYGLELLELMFEYHELKTRVPSWMRSNPWYFDDDLCGLYDDYEDDHPYDGDLGIFADYQGPDNPNYKPDFENALDDAAWAEIDRAAEEEARDLEPAPAFSGSSRHHLRARNPRGDRERYFA